MAKRICRLFLIDSFTRERFCGNPAAVVLDAEQLTEEEMRRVAREVHEEVAFVRAADSPDHDVELRFFSPRREVSFVGHATVAAHYARALVYGVPKGRVRQKSGNWIVEVQVTGCPPGLGEPVFDKLDAELARALMSVGTVKGVEVGAGFQACRLRGSQNNDQLTPKGFLSNRAGGILGGISTGQQIVLRVAVKPIPTLAKPQKTIDSEGRPHRLTVTGRHDCSAIPRILVVLEAMTCLVLADHLLRQRAARVER